MNVEKLPMIRLLAHAAIGYTAVAFITWDPDVSAWSQADRWFAICMAAGSFAIARLYSQARKDCA